MNKKGAELSMNVIIIAVLVIVVLIVLVIIFSGRIKIFGNVTQTQANPYTKSTCDIPGTGRYCATACEAGDNEVQITQPHYCMDATKGVDRCCCCKFVG